MDKINEIFNQVKINVPLLDPSNKSHITQNFLRTHTPRRERLMCPRKSYLPLILVSYCRVLSLSSTRIHVVLPLPAL